MNVLVTGATGSLGRAILELVPNDWATRAFSRREGGAGAG
jgi:uncharacterized protein YbjT (DUF2867 family)